MDWLVFAQSSSPAVDGPTLTAQSKKFFSGATLEPRAIAIRPATEDDWLAAERAESLTGAAASGLSRLARRCPTVLLISGTEDDAPAILLCAILASIHLGPILTPTRTQILGVRTARTLLGV